MCEYVFKNVKIRIHNCNARTMEIVDNMLQLAEEYRKFGTYEDFDILKLTINLDGEATEMDYHAFHKQACLDNDRKTEEYEAMQGGNLPKDFSFSWPENVQKALQKLPVTRNIYVNLSYTYYGMPVCKKQRGSLHCCTLCEYLKEQDAEYVQYVSLRTEEGKEAKPQLFSCMKHNGKIQFGLLPFDQPVSCVDNIHEWYTPDDIFCSTYGCQDAEKEKKQNKALQSTKREETAGLKTYEGFHQYLRGKLGDSLVNTVMEKGVLYAIWVCGKMTSEQLKVVIDFINRMYVPFGRRYFKRCQRCQYVIGITANSIGVMRLHAGKENEVTKVTAGIADLAWDNN